jgi:hypothetical protein
VRERGGWWWHGWQDRWRLVEIEHAVETFDEHRPHFE